MPAVAPDEFCKRSDHRHLQPFPQAVCRRYLHCQGLFREQHRHHADHHGESHGGVSHSPGRILVSACGQAAHLGVRRNPKHTRPRPNHGQAITGLVARRQHRLQAGMG